jgi:hypothetical protein
MLANVTATATHLRTGRLIAMAQQKDLRHSGLIGRLLIPGLSGVVASGLLLAAWAFDRGDGSVLGFVILVGGAALFGLIVGNPGNEAVVLTGTLLPGALLIAIEPHHGCIARLGPFLVINVGAGIGLMFLGLIFGLIAGRGAGIQQVPRPIVVAILSVAALLAASAWIALGVNLANGSIC